MGIDLGWWWACAAAVKLGERGWLDAQASASNGSYVPLLSDDAEQLSFRARRAAAIAAAARVALAVLPLLRSPKLDQAAVDDAATYLFTAAILWQGLDAAGQDHKWVRDALIRPLRSGGQPAARLDALLSAFRGGVCKQGRYPDWSLAPVCELVRGFVRHVDAALASPERASLAGETVRGLLVELRGMVVRLHLELLEASAGERNELYPATEPQPYARAAASLDVSRAAQGAMGTTWTVARAVARRRGWRVDGYDVRWRLEPEVEVWSGRVTGDSLGLACAVGLLFLLNPERPPIDQAWAFTGGVRSNEQVSSVDGYPEKLTAAAEKGVAVVVPEADLAKAQEVQRRLGLRLRALRGAATVEQALALTSEPAPPELPLGSHVGPYIITGGPTGDPADYLVYEGVEDLLEDKVWLKQYMGTSSTQEGMKWRLRDAVALRQFGEHRNLAHLITINTDLSDRFYVIMKREEGQFLRDVMRRNNLSLSQKLSVLNDILSGLAHIHRIGEHKKPALLRDLRPENVFVRRGESEEGDIAQLFSFDCVRLPGRGRTRVEVALERARRFDAYASDELLRSRNLDDVGPATDIFSWGVIAYELLTGALPYSNARAKLDSSNVDRGKLEAVVPLALSAIILESLSPYIQDRPSTEKILTAIEVVWHAK